MNRLLIWSAVLLIGVNSAHADDEAAAKIDYLLTGIGNSNCIFIRNGNEHDAAAAEKHLRMKYRRGKKYAKDAMSFIDRLATKSSFSGRPYLIRCPGQDTMPTADWLKQRLTTYTDASP